MNIIGKNEENHNSHALPGKVQQCCILPSILSFASPVHGEKWSSKFKFKSLLA